MPHKNPLGKIKDTALATLKDPIGSAGKATGQARDSVAVGRTMVWHVTERVVSRLPGRGREPDPAPVSVPPAVPAEKPRKDQGDALAPPRPVRPAEKEAADKEAVEATPADLAKKASTRPPAAKTTVKKTPAKKAPSKKAAASPGAKLPAKKAADKKAATRKTAAKKAPSKKAATTAPARAARADQG